VTSHEEDKGTSSEGGKTQALTKTRVREGQDAGFSAKGKLTEASTRFEERKNMKLNKLIKGV